MAMEDQSEIRLRFPSENIATFRSKLTFIFQEGGVTSGVDIHPLASAVEFADAVRALMQIGVDLQIERDQDFNHAIEKWSKLREPPKWFVATRLFVESKVALRIEVKKDRREILY